MVYIPLGFALRWVLSSVALTVPFVRTPRRRNRDTIAERDKALDPEIIEARRLAEAEQRKKEAHDLVADSIVRELAASKHTLPAPITSTPAKQHS